MKTSTLFAGLLVVGLVSAAVRHSVTSNGPAPTPDKIKKLVAAAPRPAAEERFKVPLGSSPARGPADALVTIVELVDLECPFSQRAVPILEQLETQFGADVRVVVKHFPLASHPNAPLAAEWAAAAAEQGKFWRFYDAVFATEGPRTEPELRRIAAEAGLDLAALDEALGSGRPRATVAEERALGERLGVAGTPAFFINGVRIAGLQPLPTFQRTIERELEAAKALVARGTPRERVYEEVTRSARDVGPVLPRPPAVVRQNVQLVADAPRRGAPDPLVTVVVWSDFECPFCGGMVGALDQLLRDHPNEVQLQFRHLPLPSHPRAEPAAKAAIAAQRQGKFWELHDQLFAHQEKLGDADLLEYAKALGLDLARFRADLASSSADAVLERDRSDAARFGVRSTPTSFVNGVPVRGAQPLAAIAAIVERELERARGLLAQGVKAQDVYQAILATEAGKPFDLEPIAPPAAGPGGKEEVALGDAPFIGSPAAPVKVVVFNDFECPYCLKLRPALDRALATYGERVAVGFKQYPLPMHRSAELASVAALAAHRQGKFRAMYGMLFDHADALGREDLVRYAKALGLDEARFAGDLDRPEVRAAVKADIAEGVRLGITATPTLFVNGKRYEGMRSYDDLRAALDEALAAVPR